MLKLFIVTVEKVRWHCWIRYANFNYTFQEVPLKFQRQKIMVLNINIIKKYLYNNLVVISFITAKWMHCIVFSIACLIIQITCVIFQFFLHINSTFIPEIIIINTKNLNVTNQVILKLCSISCTLTLTKILLKVFF